MGILKNREEMIPVTCAVLKDEDREHFFSAARKRVGGNMDRIAAMCGVSVSTVQDWSNGTVLIPYHALQRLAQELSIEQPQVSELRREFQAVSQIPQARRPEPEPPPSRAEARRELKKVQGTDRPPRRRERGEGKRGAKAEKAPQAPQKQKAPQRQRRAKRDAASAKQEAPARSEKGSSAPKLSDRLAYWTGALLAAARREEGRVVFSADRRMGQNFAGTWAGLTADLLGVRPVLSMSEDRKVQNADLPTAGLEQFLDRLEFKPGIGPESAPGAPRWTWSNPEWKMAFLRGLVDATARFSRAPSLGVCGLSPRLRQSAHKILTSLGFAPSDAPEGGLLLSGQEAEKYFDTVGTGNMKLKDQFKAFRRGESAPAEDDEEAPVPSQPAELVAQTEVEPPLEAPASEGEGPEEPPSGAAPEAKPAAASKRPPRRRPRRTAFRGRPGA